MTNRQNNSNYDNAENQQNSANGNSSKPIESPGLMQNAENLIVNSAHVIFYSARQALRHNLVNLLLLQLLFSYFYSSTKKDLSEN